VANSSTKKAAKLAQKGKGQKVRFQGGTIFPLAVAITLIVGLGLIVYARQSVPAADASPPTINDHWHAAYGFYLCDGWVQLNGALEERNSQGSLTNVNFLRTGIHSHDDGVIHWHPYTSRATGRNATLGVFLDSYEVEVSDDAIRFPSMGAMAPNPDHVASGPTELLQEYVEDETQCDGEDAEVTVKAWGSYTDTDGGSRYISNMGDIHIDNDGMVFGIYFTPDDAEQVMPPWAQNLPALGAIDSGQLRPEDLESLIDGETDTSVVDGEPGDPSGSLPDDDDAESDAVTSEDTTGDTTGTTTDDG
jgi:hypothetical protein